MIKVDLLHNLLNIRDEEIKTLDSEQLQLLLGVFRYCVRLLEREINERVEEGTAPELSKQV